MPDSISKWIRGLKSGDSVAAPRLWDHYSGELVKLAKTKLGSAPKTAGDEEDIALMVFSSICRGAASGRFGNVHTRDDLWWLLLTVSARKVADHARREFAQKRNPWGPAVLNLTARSPAASTSRSTI